MGAGCLALVGLGATALVVVLLMRGADQGGGSRDLRETSWIEDEIAPQVDEQSGQIIGETIHGSVVDCPPTVDWRAGNTFRCELTTPQFTPGYIEVTIEEGGRYSWFAANTE